jgi:hypothetical protein
VREDRVGLERPAAPDEQVAELAREAHARDRIVGALERCPEVPDRGRITRQRLRLAELAEDGPANLVGRGLRERATEQAHGRRRRAIRQRLARRLAERGDHRRVVGRLTAQQMSGRERAASPFGGEQQTSAAMAVGAGGGKDALVDRAPEQRMDEPQGRVGGQDLRRDQPVRSFARALLIDPGERGRLAQR